MAADNEHAHMTDTVNQIGCVTFVHPCRWTELAKLLPASDHYSFRHILPSYLPTVVEYLVQWWNPS